MDEIKKLRLEFQEIDRSILLLLGRRKNVSMRIAKLKKENKFPVLQEDIWNLNLRNRLEENKEFGLDEEFVRMIFNAIHEESIRIQQQENL